MKKSNKKTNCLLAKKFSAIMQKDFNLVKNFKYTVLVPAAILLVAVISLFLSLIIGIGSINFLKAFWYYKTTKVKGE